VTFSDTTKPKAHANVVSDWEARANACADLSSYCRCGDHESDHLEDVFVSRRPDGRPGRACIIPFCRCPAFTAMVAWFPWTKETP
jgi:hypothetical protein